MMLSISWWLLTLLGCESLFHFTNGELDGLASGRLEPDHARYALGVVRVDFSKRDVFISQYF